MNVNVLRMHRINSEAKPFLKAAASIVLYGCVQVDNILIKYSDDKNILYVDFPTYKKANGEYAPVCNPITKEAFYDIKNALIDAYNQTDEDITNKFDKAYIDDNDIKIENISCAFSLRKYEKENASTKAFGSVVLNKEFVVNNVSLRNGIDPETQKPSMFLSMPAKQDENGAWWSVAHFLNKTTAEFVRRSALTAYSALDSQSIGNISYKELKDSVTELSHFKNQNVKYAMKIGNELTEMGVRWSGKVDNSGVLISISADDAMSYSNAERNVKDKARLQIKANENTKEIHKDAEKEESVFDSENFFRMDGELEI